MKENGRGELVFQQPVNAYFEGVLPFAKKKSRTDLPDGFIYEALADLAAQRTRLIFVSSDERMRAASERLPHVQAFSSLKELLELPELAAILGEGVLDSQLKLLRDVFESWVRQSDSLQSAITSELLGRRVHFFYPLEGYYRVTAVSQLDRVVPEALPANLGEGTLLIPFSGRATCNVSLVRGESLGDGQVPSPETDLLRLLVFAGSVRLSLPTDVLGRAVGRDRVIEVLEAAAVAIEDLALHWEADGKPLPDGVFPWHAFDEARRQVLAGDLETEVDKAEDKDRNDRARWFSFPEDLQGQHGKLRLTQDSRIQIAPMPRFEHWVRFLKRLLLEELDQRDPPAIS